MTRKCKYYGLSLRVICKAVCKPVSYLLLFVPLCSRAQEDQLSTRSSQAASLYHEAQIQVNIQNWDQAKMLLLKAINKDSRFAEGTELLADIYRKQQNWTEAETSYEKVIALKPAFLIATQYGLGITQFHLMKYNEASLNFGKYIESGHGSDKRMTECKKYLENSHFALGEMTHPKPFLPVNLGSQVNTGADEYLPSVTIDDSTLIFTRRQSNEDFYVSSFSDAGWSKARSLDETINTPEYNEGAGCISADGQYLYCTICGRPGVMGRCDIYYSKKIGYHWDEPKNLGPEVNTEGWESQPSISADGNTLYFTSSRAGGFGGFDIWKTHKLAGGHWSAPENLGPDINTAGNEISPFIHADNQTLYFSSDGLTGMGGKDLYFSRKTARGKWGKPQNLGYPINTASDESTLIVSADGRKAYFASNSIKGYGGFDLYSFELYSEARPEKVSYVKGNVFDKQSLDRIDARVEVISLKDGTVVYSSMSNIVNGAFLAGLPTGAEYVFHVSKKGYIFYSANLDLKKGDTSFRHSLDIPLRRIALGLKDVLRNVFFETDSYVLRHESKIELEKLAAFMKMNPGVSIEISGHTDDQGSEKHNVSLSENRAKAVYTWLVTVAKIEAGRFSFKGYGKSQPVASNKEEAGRALNRRTEFMITAMPAR